MAPSFFKILRNPSAPHLSLPPDFVSKHMENKIPKGPIIVSASGGHTWTLKIKKIGDDHCFTNGWKNVVKDIPLIYADFLVFHLVDPSVFRMTIFSPNGCEEILPPKVAVDVANDEAENVVITDDDNDVEEETEEDNAATATAAADDDDDDDNDDGDEEEENEEGDDDDNDVEEETEDNAAATTVAAAATTTATTATAADDNDDGDEEEENEEGDDDDNDVEEETEDNAATTIVAAAAATTAAATTTTAATTATTAATATAADDDDDGDEEEENEEGDPMFTTVITQLHKNMLRFPSDFAALAGIDKQGTIVMKNTDGTERCMRVRMELVNSCTKRFYMTTGWRNVMVENHLSEGDKCVFRFIRSEGKLLLIKVTKPKRVKTHPPLLSGVKRKGGRPLKKKRGRPPKSAAVNTTRS